MAEQKCPRLEGLDLERIRNGDYKNASDILRVAAQWGWDKAMAQRHAVTWPEPISDRPPNEADGDENGMVQCRTELGRWYYCYWYVAKRHQCPWLHTPGWSPPAPALSLREQAIEALQRRVKLTLHPETTAAIELALRALEGGND